MNSAQNNIGRIFVTGDLNVDEIVTGVRLGSINEVNEIKKEVGGSAINAAKGFKNQGFKTVIWGSVGNDDNGKLILGEIDKCMIKNAVNIHQSKPTGVCHIIYFQGDNDMRTIYYVRNNANDYQVSFLEKALKWAEISGDDYIYSSLHCFYQLNDDVDHCKSYIQVLRDSGAKLIIDLTPHLIFVKIGLDEIRSIIGGTVFLLIAEYRTFMGFINPGSDENKKVENSSLQKIASAFQAEYYDCRFGKGNISRQILFKKHTRGIQTLSYIEETGYKNLADNEKSGFGDILTARTLQNLICS